MRIAIVTQYYPPEIGAPQRRLSELAERMYGAGHEVIVLTAMPNYPQGRIHPGYGGVLRREQHGGISVIRTFIYPTQKATFVHRLTNYFSFVLSSLILGTFLLPRLDFLMVESPPLFLGITGIWLARIKRARLIFNVSDLWPESAIRLGLVSEGSRIHRLSLWLERQCYRAAWLITGQSKGILRDICSRFPDRQSFYLSNGVDISKFGSQYFDPAAQKQIKLPDQIAAVYAGLHGLAQGLDQLVAAAEKLQAEKELVLVLIGDGPEKQALATKVQSKKLDNIRFLEPVPASAVPAQLAASDIILITLKSYIPGAVPSKLYEAMASGKPVIMVASGEPADIVNEHRTGITVEPGDIDGIVAALRALASDPDLRAQFGRNGRSAAEKYFNRDTIVGSFIVHLEKANR